jgi:hypothetical protein
VCQPTCCGPEPCVSREAHGWRTPDAACGCNLSHHSECVACQLVPGVTAAETESACQWCGNEGAPKSYIGLLPTSSRAQFRCVHHNDSPGELHVPVERVECGCVRGVSTALRSVVMHVHSD